MVETKRLLIKPLTLGQLEMYIRNDFSLEMELKVSHFTRTISSELQEAIEQTILPNVADLSKNYLYSTLWTIISKEDNKMVGDLCFMGEPGASDEVEIGYGIYTEFRCRGFMTEAVAGMIEWAKAQPCIKSILSSTEKNNPASFAVLKKNNFAKTGETDMLINWRLEI